MPLQDVLPKTITLPFDPYWALNMPRGAKFELWILDGHCMEPTLMHGSLIFVRKLKPKHGDIVRAAVDGKHLIKRYLIIDGKPVLRRDNPAHPDPVWQHEMEYWGLL